jgi:selenoprotein W-related protein
LAENLLTRWSDQIASLTLIPSEGGLFEVDVDDVRIYSKAQTGRHAQPGEVESLFEQQLSKR